MRCSGTPDGGSLASRPSRARATREVQGSAMSDITDLPLSGVRILDCVDGPLQGVGRILADLGADVIRVEPPAGSPARHDGQLVDEVSLTFAVRNANKHGAAL